MPPRPRIFPSPAHERVRLAPNVDLADPAGRCLLRRVTDLWASIHLAGGFTDAPVEKTEPASFAEMMDTNARTAFLCCRAAVRSMLHTCRVGRIVNVTARAGLDLRGFRHGRLCREQGGGRGNDRGAGRRTQGQGHPGQRGRALDARHAGQPG